MDVWGSDNFDNDAAQDVLGDMVDVALTEIRGFCASNRNTVEDLDTILACVAAHLALHKHCGAARPELSVATMLHEKVIDIYDKGIDALKPQADFKKERRAVVLNTLSEYKRAAEGEK
jgi:hypothetical protein